MAKKKTIDIVKLLPGIQKNILLKNYTTFKIGGKAKYFFVAKTEKDLILAIRTAKEAGLSFFIPERQRRNKVLAGGKVFILGRGSNLLVSDRGYNGLIIKILNSKFKIINSKIVAETGIMLGKLADGAARGGFWGLEWTAGIPGTLGGAVRGNAGAFGSSIADNIQAVKVYDTKKKRIIILKNKDCDFGYRSSIFKKKKNLIILSVTLKLKRGRKEEIKNKSREYLSYRTKNQPLNFPSAGSIFVNPQGFSVGELIEKCGLKGKKIGRAQISEVHANFIVNLGGAKAKDVKKLIDLAERKVKQKFGLTLKEEIEYLD